MPVDTPLTSPSSLQLAVKSLHPNPISSPFLVSGSSDSNVHCWSLPSLLSFSQPSQNDPSQPRPYSPLRTLSNHRAAINAVVFGHSASKANFSISAANDKTCLVWDYFTGTILHTYLLSSNPLCLTLDPADRAAYAGYEDGSIQILDFYKQKSSLIHPHYDANKQSTPAQPPDSDRWSSSETASSPAHCLQLSYDGTTLLGGHENGKVHTWNIAKGKYNNQLADLTLPVTNLIMLPPTGFPTQNPGTTKLQNVVKPKYENSFSGATDTNGTSAVPINYAYTAQFTSTLPLPDPPAGYSDLDEALTHPSFPRHMLDEGIAELESLATAHPHNPNKQSSDRPELTTLRTQNAALKTQLDTALARQRTAIAEVLGLEKEIFRREEDEVLKRARKKRRRGRRMEGEERRRRGVMGEVGGREEEREGGMVGEGEGEGEGEGGEGLSSDTEEVESD
ncbi:MAG: hypothetical protein LQ350_002112 [Teloschistes chrysophthalmus]|nr:MAG: hypothetical protein LQ350_002112 [Niorma chrysophthalma]